MFALVNKPSWSAKFTTRLLYLHLNHLSHPAQQQLYCTWSMRVFMTSGLPTFRTA